MFLVTVSVAVVVVVVGFGRTAWRLWRGNDEPVAGGSDGQQMFRRIKRSKKKLG